MAKSCDGEKIAATQQPLTIGLVLELETLLFPGRPLLYQTMERALKDKDIALTPCLAARFGLHLTQVKNLEKLFAALAKKKLSAAKLLQDIHERLQQQIKKSPPAPSAAMQAILADAAKAGVPIGALSCLPAGLAQELLKPYADKFALAALITADKLNGCFSSDGWLALAKAINRPAQACLALTTSAEACKSALVAGMRCLVFPDAYTSHQDFSGADEVVEGSRELRFKDIAALARPNSFRSAALK